MRKIKEYLLKKENKAELFDIVKQLNDCNSYLEYLTERELIHYTEEEIMKEIEKNIEDVIVCLMNWSERVKIGSELRELIIEYYIR